jgi:hypothetical protein
MMSESRTPVVQLRPQAPVPAVNPFTYPGPDNADPDEVRIFANANGYAWAYLDTCRENGVAARPFPDGWAFAYLEHHRRQGHHYRAIREAFRLWRDTATLPGLTNLDTPQPKGEPR